MSKIIPGKIICKRKIQSSTYPGIIYTTSIYENCVSCTCPAGGNKMLCKHVIKVVYDNFELIKREYPHFVKELIEYIEVKNDPNTSVQKLKKYASKLVYVDKLIKEESYKNSEKYEKYKEIEENSITELYRNTDEDTKKGLKYGCTGCLSIFLVPVCIFLGSSNNNLYFGLFIFLIIALIFFIKAVIALSKNNF